MLPYAYAAMCAFLLLSTVCGDDSTERGLSEAEPFLNKGYSYIESKEYRQAIEEYDKALQIEPNAAEVYGNRGVAYAEFWRAPQGN